MRDVHGIARNARAINFRLKLRVGMPEFKTLRYSFSHDISRAAAIDALLDALLKGTFTYSICSVNYSQDKKSWCKQTSTICDIH